MRTIALHNSFLTLTPIARLILLLIVVWSIIWKGFALWRAGRNDQPVWFVFLLILNTVGILEIIYLIFFSHPKQKIPAAPQQL
jgi:methionyl-tRNA synthetase